MKSAGYQSVTAEFPPQRPVTWSFGVFIDLALNKRLTRQLPRRWRAQNLVVIRRVHFKPGTSNGSVFIMVVLITLDAFTMYNAYIRQSEILCGLYVFVIRLNIL